MEEKNIIVLFGEKVVSELKAALAERQKKDSNEKSAMVKFNVGEVLRSLGATNVTLAVSVAKDYTWLRASASKDGFYHPVDFSQRCQAKTAELNTVKEEIAGVPLHEAICIAGIYADGEETRFSMKWDELQIADEDGIVESFRFTGPVRKWDAKKSAYDGPVAE